MSDDSSYVEGNVHVLKELANLNLPKRRFILSNGGPDLILAFAEIFWNLIHNSDKNNLKDLKIIKLIKKNYNDIGILIHSSSSIRKKRAVLLNNPSLLKLALNQGLSGYEFFKKNS